jgi:hypothetical protein
MEAPLQRRPTVLQSSAHQQRRGGMFFFIVGLLNMLCTFGTSTGESTSGMAMERQLSLGTLLEGCWKKKEGCR